MWRLRPYVMSALKKLQEAGRPLILVCHRAQPFAAHVTKPDEVLLYQHPKSLNSSEVRIKQELGQATDLGCLVPAITTVHQRVAAIPDNERNLEGGAEEQADVIQPSTRREFR